MLLNNIGSKTIKMSNSERITIANYLYGMGLLSNERMQNLKRQDDPNFDFDKWDSLFRHEYVPLSLDYS